MIFISYSWVDSMFAQRIANFLNEQGHQVWIDYQNLDLDEPLEPQLALAIGAADVFLFISSPHAYSSRWVQLELCLAKACHKSIQVVHVPFECCYFVLKIHKTTEFLISNMLPNNSLRAD